MAGPIVPRGPDGAFDKDLILPASTIVTHDDRHWIYYAGANERHGTEAVRFGRSHAIGLATLPVDRLVGIAADDRAASAGPGTVVTRTFSFAGRTLAVNADARGGSLAIEVLDAAGKPLAGFSGEDAALLVDRDELRWAPRFGRNADLSSLHDKDVRLRLTLRSAAAYAFQVQ